MEKKCSKCKKSLPHKDFYKFKRSSDGLTSYCRSCHQDVSKQAAQRAVLEKKLLKEPLPAICNTCSRPHPLGPTGRQRKCVACAHETWIANKKKEGIEVTHRQGKVPHSPQYSQLYRQAQKELPQVCQICGVTEAQEKARTGKRLAVDHNHETNEIRGMLCRSCNLALGGFKDDRDLLKQAILYLDRYARA